MDNAQNDRRQKMLEKVRKLLAMGKGNANANESETAMRQANKLMAEFGIDEAEADMTAIDKGEMIFGEAQCGFDGRAPEAGKVYRQMPAYASSLCLGVAKFTDTIVIRKTTQNGEMIVFRGEKNDVLLARWILCCLVESILMEQKASGWTTKADANTFRVNAASVLIRRLYALHAERQAMYKQAQQESNCRALVVVDRKGTEIAQRFGTQKVRNSSARCRGSSGAAQAGQSAGSRINIPSGRPLGQSQNGRIAA
jgi:hypothetical protein